MILSANSLELDSKAVSQGAQVEAYYFGSPQQIARKILFIKRANRLADYKAFFTDRYEFGNVWHGFTGVFRGEEITIIATGIGPSMVGDCIYALDRKDALCVYSGTCGGLSDDIKIGDYVIADNVICGDGYSLLHNHSFLSTIYSDKRLRNSIEQTFLRQNITFFRGTTFATASVVLEITPQFWRLVPAHCKAIEMEAAAFYASALATRKKAIAYFWVTDLPRRNKSFFDQLTDEEIGRKQVAYEASVALDLETISSLKG